MLFAHRLNESSDAVSRFVRQSMTNIVGHIPSDVTTDRDPPPAETQLALTHELNKLIAGDSIYEEQRFAGVKLSPQTQALVDKQRERRARREQLTDDEQVRLNRFLLEDAFPTALTQNQNRPVRFVVPAGWFQSLGASLSSCLRRCSPPSG